VFVKNGQAHQTTSGNRYAARTAECLENAGIPGEHWNAARILEFCENTGVQRENWLQAVHEELESLEENNTWEIVPNPIGKKVIDSKWVFTSKHDDKGEIERHKARLVIKGCAQKRGNLCSCSTIDNFKNTFVSDHCSEYACSSIRCSKCIYTWGIERGNIHETTHWIEHRK
jgi:hypothetical protein